MRKSFFNFTALRKFLKMLFLKIYIFVLQHVKKIIQLEHRIYLGQIVFCLVVFLLYVPSC